MCARTSHNRTVCAPQLRRGHRRQAAHIQPGTLCAVCYVQFAR
jgi:hypothetical protein